MTPGRSVPKGSVGSLLVCLACLALAPARASAPVQEPPPRFAAEADLITVDVVVIDPDGQPVRGLTRDDFVVKEDGRRQSIAAFEAVEAAVPEIVAPETTVTRSAARVATNVSASPTRRTFAIVFDDLHVDELDMEQARSAVEAFVAAQTVPGDRLVLVTVSGGRFWTTTRGGRDAAFLDALRSVRSRRPAQGRAECRIGYYEAMQIEAMGNSRVADLVARRLAGLCAPPTTRPSPEQLARGAVATELTRAGVSIPSGGPSEGPPASSGSGSSLAPSPAEVYARERGLLTGTLRVVREIVARLGEVPDRKSLVLVTEGFPVDPSLDAFREVREEAARANVAIHFLDARGLVTGPELLSASGSTGLVPGPDVGLTVALWKLEDAGAKALAEQTGGLVLQANDLLAGLEKVAEESLVTYLLGYEPTNRKRDGRYRRLKVEVRRPGLTVRARAGYFAPKGRKKETPEPPAAERALGHPFDAEGIPLRLAAHVMGPAPLPGPVPKTGVEVLLAGEVRLDALKTWRRGGRTVAEPRLRLLAGARSGEWHDSEWTLWIALSSAAGEAPPAKAWHPFLTRIAMAPGDHRARLVVESGDRVGSVTVDFVIPAFTEERLSTPILTDRIVSRPGERRVMPVARRSFPASSTLHAWVELHGAAVDRDLGRRRATASVVARSADGREWASGTPAAMALESGTPSRLVSIPLADAPPGENELVLTVRDEVSGRTFEAREPFRVE